MGTPDVVPSLLAPRTVPEWLPICIPRSQMPPASLSDRASQSGQKLSRRPDLAPATGYFAFGPDRLRQLFVWCCLPLACRL
ncbi:hypothetical protein FKM82_030470 [Ascaphus truei]